MVSIHRPEIPISIGSNWLSSPISTWLGFDLRLEAPDKKREVPVGSPAPCLCQPSDSGFRHPCGGGWCLDHGQWRRLDTGVSFSSPDSPNRLWIGDLTDCMNYVSSAG